MIVVDASVVVEGLVGGGSLGDQARLLLQRPDQLLAPHLLDVESASALRRLLFKGAVGESLASSAMLQLRRFPIERVPHQPFLPRIWELRGGVSAYDAAYIALAEAADEPLATLDSRLAKAPGIACEVMVLS